MNQSAIEREIERRIGFLSTVLRHYDRGAVIGLVLCAIPVLPVPLAGMTLSAVNLILLRNGRLGTENRGLVLLSLAIGTVATLLGILLAISVYHVGAFLLGHVMDFIRFRLFPAHSVTYTNLSATCFFT